MPSRDSVKVKFLGTDNFVVSGDDVYIIFFSKAEQLWQMSHGKGAISYLWIHGKKEKKNRTPCGW
jgi:hypothetical protein